jgi:hypothetical protein
MVAGDARILEGPRVQRPKRRLVGLPRRAGCSDWERLTSAEMSLDLPQPEDGPADERGGVT